MLNERLKELREEVELNQEDFAKELNVGRSTYASWETGRAEPGIDILINIANFYNVSLDFLCGNTDIKYKFYEDPRLCKYINRCILIYKDFLKD